MFETTSEVDMKDKKCLKCVGLFSVKERATEMNLCWSKNCNKQRNKDSTVTS